MSQGGGYGGSGGYGQNMGGGYGGGNSYGGGGWGGQPQGMGIDQRYSPLQFGGSPSYNQAWGVPQGGPRMVSDPASSFNSTGAGSDGIRPGLGNITPPPQPSPEGGGQRPPWGITPPPQPSPEGGGQRPPWGITPPPQPSPEGGGPTFPPGPVPPPQPVGYSGTQIQTGTGTPMASGAYGGLMNMGGAQGGGGYAQPMTDNPWNRFQRGPMPPNRWGGY